MCVAPSLLNLNMFNTNRKHGIWKWFLFTRLDAIIDVTGANIYHGFLPSLVRKCIVHMVEPDKPAFPHSFSTALFSFLYHLASYESGGEALLACGIMPSLLQLASWYSDEQEHITVSFSKMFTYGWCIQISLNVEAHWQKLSLALPELQVSFGVCHPVSIGHVCSYNWLGV